MNILPIARVLCQTLGASIPFSGSQSRLDKGIVTAER